MSKVNPEMLEGLEAHACDSFNAASSVVKRGKEILDEIKEILLTLEAMENLKEVCVCSCNNSCWRPKISTDDLKKFVRGFLEERREVLKNQFNKFL